MGVAVFGGNRSRQVSDGDVLIQPSLSRDDESQWVVMFSDEVLLDQIIAIASGC